MNLDVAYADLEVHEQTGLADGSTAFGKDDQLGTVNRLTPDALIAAAAEIRTGETIALSLPLTEPGKEGGPPSRAALTHHMFRAPFPGPPENFYQDDYLDNFYLQGSTQWDGLRHIRAGTAGFYNRVSDAAAGPAGDRLGIEHWAQRGIVGRAVLADVVGYFAAAGTPIDPFAPVDIDHELLEAVLDHFAVERRPGDILLVHTGFVAAFLALPREQRAEARERRQWPGLSGTEAMARYLWDSGFAAVAADNVTLEMSPLSPDPLHIRLAMLGFPMGEYFDLTALTERSGADGRYSCFLTAVPLCLVGGAGSPANAVAIR